MILAQWKFCFMNLFNFSVINLGWFVHASFFIFSVPGDSVLYGSLVVVRAARAGRAGLLTALSSYLMSAAQNLHFLWCHFFFWRLLDGWSNSSAAGQCCGKRKPSTKIIMAQSWAEPLHGDRFSWCICNPSSEIEMSFIKIKHKNHYSF